MDVNEWTKDQEEKIGAAKDGVDGIGVSEELAITLAFVYVVIFDDMVADVAVVDTMYGDTVGVADEVSVKGWRNDGIHVVGVMRKDIRIL